MIYVHVRASWSLQKLEVLLGEWFIQEDKDPYHFNVFKGNSQQLILALQWWQEHQAIYHRAFQTEISTTAFVFGINAALQYTSVINLDSFKK